MKLTHDQITRIADSDQREELLFLLTEAMKLPEVPQGKVEEIEGLAKQILGKTVNKITYRVLVESALDIHIQHQLEFDWI